MGRTVRPGGRTRGRGLVPPRASGRRTRLALLLAVGALALGAGALATLSRGLPAGSGSERAADGSRTPPAAGVAPAGPSAPSLVEGTSLGLGEPFPRFRVEDVDGRVLTNARLRGKPVIVWYTTSYCLPCAVGAQAVSALDEELGDRAFDVLMVFVDPGETPGTLEAWRTQYGRPDWMVVLDRDGSLARAVGLQFLDSKFLLDREGRVVNIDFAVADDRYLDRVERVVRGG